MTSKKSNSRARSRGRPRKTKNTTIAPTKEDRHTPSPAVSENESDDEAYQPVKDPKDIEDDKIMQEIEESAKARALATEKNASTPTKTNTTTANVENTSTNPAQAKVNRALNTITSYQDKLTQLKNRAAEKANEKKRHEKLGRLKKVRMQSLIITILMNKHLTPIMTLKLTMIRPMKTIIKEERIRNKKKLNLHPKQNLPHMATPTLITML